MTTRPMTRAPHSIRHTQVAALALTLMLSAHTLSTPAEAAPLTAVAGYDHYSGPFGQQTDGVLGALVLSAARSDFMIAGVRYDDTSIGRGTGLTAGVGVPIAGAARLRVAGTRFLGDASFRAWRARIGPQFSLPGGRSVAVSYAHYQDNLSARSHGVIGEGATPLIARLGGRVTAAYATTPQGPAAVQGSVGLSWNAIRTLELSGEVGLSRNASGAAGQSFPTRSAMDGLPILGGGGSGSSTTQETSQSVEGTILLGVRVTFP